LSSARDAPTINPILDGGACYSTLAAIPSALRQSLRPTSPGEVIAKARLIDASRLPYIS
jgi:hypothetical protein